MIKSAADLILGVWNAPEVPLRVEYPLEIMEELRARVSDELQRLSRGGADPAGLLFGISRGPVARILTWRPISRDPADEQARPGLRAELVRVLGGAATDPDMRGMEPLGWFVSRAQGAPTGLTPHEIELFNNFFPNSWQFTLLVRRGPGGTARAGFFVRDAGGYLRADASYRELLIQPVRRVPGAPEPSPPLASVPPVPQASRPFFEPERNHGSAPETAVAEAAIPMPASPAAEERQIPFVVSPMTAPAELILQPGESREPALSEPAMKPSSAGQATEPLPKPPPGDPQSQTPSPAPTAPVPAVELRTAETQGAGEITSVETAPHAPEALTEGQSEGQIAARQAEQPQSSEAQTAKLPAAEQRASAPATDQLAKAQPGGTLLAEAPTEETPSFLLQAHSFGGARWLWVFPLLLAIGVVVFLLMQKTAPVPTPSFSFRVAAANDNNVEISWDRNSLPVRDGQRAEIQIQDGPDHKQLSLSPDQLHDGVTNYTRQSGDVALQMIIYAAGGREFHEFAHLAAIPASAGAPPAQESPDTGELRSQRDDLQTQVQQLKDQVKKEASRANQAESVVRVLENRLNIRPDDKKKSK